MLLDKLLNYPEAKASSDACFCNEKGLKEPLDAGPGDVRGKNLVNKRKRAAKSGYSKFSFVAAELGQKVEYLEIQPDKRDHEAEGSVPLHIFGRTMLNAALDEVEVENKVE